MDVLLALHQPGWAVTSVIVLISKVQEFWTIVIVGATYQ